MHTPGLKLRKNSRSSMLATSAATPLVSRKEGYYLKNDYSETNFEIEGFEVVYAPV